MLPDPLELRADAAALDVDAVRREVTGRVSCSWLPDVALSIFERAVVRVLEVVDFACSFLSGDSDVFVMKKTPFYAIYAT